MATTPNDEPGNDARDTGDRLGFPHPITSGEDDYVSLEDARSTLPEGCVVTHDGTNIAEVDGGGTDDVLGILYTLPVYGDSSRAGPYVREDRDATVAVRGSYTADLGPYVTNAGGTLDPGTVLGNNGRIFVKDVVDDTNDVYEVIVR